MIGQVILIENGCLNVRHSRAIHKNTIRNYRESEKPPSWLELFRIVSDKTNTFHFVYVRVKELTNRYDFNIVLNFEMDSC